MLSRLSIKNYAIIDELEIDFSNNLNIITGETGAGKSIIVGALSLILGARADTTVLVNKKKKCIIEGIFSAIDNKAVEDFWQENQLDREDEIIIRREIAANGKSRAFINDTPVKLTQLEELSTWLVDLHQQFDVQELVQADFQLQVVDAMAGHENLLKTYRDIFQQWKTARQELMNLQQQKDQFDKEADYNQFQFEELQEAGFKENELEEIEAALKLSNNAEAIKEALLKVNFALSESEEPMVQKLKILLQQLTPFADAHPSLPPLIERLAATQIELQDIAADLEKMGDHIQYDAEKVEEMNERLSLGYKLQQKHGLHSTAELLALQEDLNRKLQTVLKIDDDILQAKKETDTLFAAAKSNAEKISAQRKKHCKPLEEKVNTLIKQVGMPNARLKIAMESVPLHASGADRVEFLFNANLPATQKMNENLFVPIRKVASGGELNRLMLSIKSLVAASMDLPSLIFDEIDTGISGEAAKQVGIIMKQLAANRQVIAITHQPQIAGKADAHFFVYKEIVQDEVKTNIRRLSKEERVLAIAKMLSGEKPTAVAMENAREMLMN